MTNDDALYWKNRALKAEERVRELVGERDGYIEAMNSVRQLSRQLDIAMHGEENAAPQASLCDLVAPAKAFRKWILESDSILKICRMELSAMYRVAGITGKPVSNMVLSTIDKVLSDRPAK